MPRKSRQRRGKYSVQARKGVQPEAAAASPRPETARAAAPEPAMSPADATAPAVQQPEPVVSRNPFIKAELRTISIIAALMLLLLIVLAQIVG